MAYLKFNPEGCVVVQLMSGQPPEAVWDDNYGGKWQYSYDVNVLNIIQGVEVKGKDNCVFYATDTHHRMIQSTSPQISSQFKIWKTQVNNKAAYRLFSGSGDDWVEIPDPGPSGAKPKPAPTGSPGAQPAGAAPGDPTYDYSQSQVPGSGAPPDDRATPQAQSPPVQNAQPTVSDRTPILLMSRSVAALVAECTRLICPVPVFNDREMQTSIAIQMENNNMTMEDLKAERDLCMKALNPPEGVLVAFDICWDWMSKQEPPDPLVVETLRVGVNRRPAAEPKTSPAATEKPEAEPGPWVMSLDVGKPNAQRTVVDPNAPEYSESNPPPAELAKAWLDAGYAIGEVDANKVKVHYGDDLPF